MNKGLSSAILAGALATTGNLHADNDKPQYSCNLEDRNCPAIMACVENGGDYHECVDQTLEGLVNMKIFQIMNDPNPGQCPVDKDYEVPFS